jgi:uncharacterized protein YbjT (DUF2867 family)
VTQGRVLLTGATGYIGGRLLRRLEEGGRPVRCLARDPERVATSRATTEVVRGDCLDEASLGQALADVHTAYYLVHSMAAGSGFAERDRQAATNFGRAASRAGVRRIIYLGGLADDIGSLSTHLRSRAETGAALRRSGVPVIEFRASIVIGAGSLSFEMIRALVERLPAMVCPRWVSTLTQPIAVDDVLAYLTAALDLPEDGDRIFEIGGLEVVSYGDMMREYARARGLRRLLLPVPVLTPHLSGLWLALVAPAQARIGRALVESLRNPTVVHSTAARVAFSIEPMPLRDAIAKAIDDGAAANLKRDSRQVVVRATPAAAFAGIRRIGGSSGWYFGDLLWQLRGRIDRALGGVGMARGRRDRDECRPGDVIDGWTVEDYEPDRRLKLSADLKLPGRGWLEFEVTPVDEHASLIRQTATFDPRGVFGRMYWFAVLPLHALIFRGLLRNLARRAEAERAVVRTLVVFALLLASAASVASGQDTSGMAMVRGHVVGAGDVRRKDVAVCAPATAQCAVTDPDGSFTLTLRPGTYVLEIAAPGQPVVVSGDIQVRAGVDHLIELRLPEGQDLQQTVTVTAPALAAPEEVKTSGFLIPAQDIAASAGALQDVARYVQSLPGVVIGTDDFRNDLIVRGGSPLENLYVFDNVEIPNINSFATFASAGGTVSLLDVQLIDNVTFLTGGYPAPFGNRTSSVLQVTGREGRRDRRGGRATVGFAGAGAVVEGPIGSAQKGSWILSVRRSFLDLFTSDTGIGGVPVLYTLNAKAVYDLSPRDRLSAVNVSGVDTIRLGLTEDSDLSDELANLDIKYDGWRSAADDRTRPSTRNGRARSVVRCTTCRVRTRCGHPTISASTCVWTGRSASAAVTRPYSRAHRTSQTVATSPAIHGIGATTRSSPWISSAFFRSSGLNGRSETVRRRPPRRFRRAAWPADVRPFLALDRLSLDDRQSAHLVFTAHSIPASMAGADRYRRQITESSRLVAEALERNDWAVVFQSRSGRPEDPWLGPDVCAYLRGLAGKAPAVVLVPIGFVCDHIEVLYDLDREAADVCRTIGLSMARARTVNDDPKFLDMLAELVIGVCDRYRTGRPLPLLPPLGPAEQPAVSQLAAGDN